MDKEILKQYVNLVREFECEELRIINMQIQIDELTPKFENVTDVVTKGRHGKKPLGICTIHGVEDVSISRRRAKIRERKARQELRLSRIENMIIDVEECINDVADSETRMMMRLFFIEGQAWPEVAKSMGQGYTPDACKKKVQRELGKI